MFTPLAEGTITSPKGFLAGAVYCGLKHRRESLDLGLLLSERAATAAGVFTKNKIQAGSIVVSREHLGKAKGVARAIIANSGSANACVGEQGLKDAQEMAQLVARKLNFSSEEVLVASTGVIGVELPMGLIRTGVENLQPSPGSGHDFARSILTTDTRTKEVAVSFKLGRQQATIGGVAKGSGMIHPNMATMLCFLTTDAAVETRYLDQALRESVDDSFNMISVDGDTSTNDCVFLLANGSLGNKPLRTGSPGARTFEEALTYVCTSLAKEIVRDGEGASKLVIVVVEGARSLADARQAARTIASSTLLKAAVRGCDPNWGRVLAALGRSGAEIQDDKLRVDINGICTLDGGVPIPFYREAAVAAMSEAEVTIRVSLNLGNFSAAAWGCDLTEEYVKINSSYTT